MVPSHELPVGVAQEALIGWAMAKLRAALRLPPAEAQLLPSDLHVEVNFYPLLGWSTITLATRYVDQNGARHLHRTVLKNVDLDQVAREIAAVADGTLTSE